MTEMIVLAITGVLATLVRAFVTRGQAMLSRDTVGECFLALVTGGLYNYLIGPSLASALEIAPHPDPTVNLAVKVLLLGGAVYITGDVIQNLLPGVLAKLVPVKRNGPTPVLAALVLLPALGLAGCATISAVRSDAHPLVKAGAVLDKAGRILVDVNTIYEAQNTAGKLAADEFAKWQSTKTTAKAAWLAAKDALSGGEATNLPAFLADYSTTLIGRLAGSGMPIEQTIALTLVLRELTAVPFPSVIPAVSEEQQPAWDATKARLAATAELVGKL